MRYQIAALALAGAAAFASACTVKPQPVEIVNAPTTAHAEPAVALPTTTAPKPYTAPPAYTAPKATYEPTPADYERAFIATLDGEGIYYATPAAAIEVGHLICDQLDAGYSPVTISHVLGSVETDASYTSGQLGFLIGASIGAFCQEYEYLVN